nr:60S ribosomal protein L27 [Cryptomonas curvata]
MSLTYKQGRIVVVLNGRFSGCKAVIINNKNLSIGKNSQIFESVCLLGIQKYPSNIKKKMNKAKQIKNHKIKIFLKSMNKNHFLPTRYNIDFGETNNEKIKKFVTDYFWYKKSKDEFKNKEFNYKNQFNFIKNVLLDKYLSNKNKWFFSKLNF